MLLLHMTHLLHKIIGDHRRMVEDQLPAGPDRLPDPSGKLPHCRQLDGLHVSDAPDCLIVRQRMMKKAGKSRRISQRQYLLCQSPGRNILCTGPQDHS